MPRQENPVPTERQVAEVISHGPVRMASLGLDFQRMTENGWGWGGRVYEGQITYLKESPLGTDGQRLKMQVVANDGQTLICKEELDPAGFSLAMVEIVESYSSTGAPEDLII